MRKGRIHLPNQPRPENGKHFYTQNNRPPPARSARQSSTNYDSDLAAVALSAAQSVERGLIGLPGRQAALLFCHKQTTEAHLPWNPSTRHLVLPVPLTRRFGAHRGRVAPPAPRHGPGWV